MFFITKVEITVSGATDIMIITVSIGIKVVIMIVQTIVFGAVLFCHTMFRPHYQYACVKKNKTKLSDDIDV